MMVRRIVLLVLATGILWKCLTVLLGPLAPDERAENPQQPPAVERAPAPPPNAAPASKRRILRGQLLLSLQEQQVALDLCIPTSRIDKTLVSLELELLEGKARIADVNLVTEDTPDPAMLACVQTALRDRMLTAASATPTAKRTRVVFRLEDYL